MGGAGFLGFSPGKLANPLIASGAELWIDPVGLVLVPASSDLYGWAELVGPIPAGPVVAGLTTHAQFFWFDGSAPGGVSASNALEIVVQP